MSNYVLAGAIRHILRPSDAPYWMLCAAKPSFTWGMPNESGEPAALGTCKHGTAETCVELGFMEADMFLGDEVEADGFTFTIDDDYIEHVNAAVAKAKELTEGATWIQTEVNLPMDLLYGEGAPEKGGTADLVAYWADEERLLVIDYKFGRKPRYVDPQLHSYGYSAMHKQHEGGFDV